jgi:hypothetical protein
MRVCVTGIADFHAGLKCDCDAVVWTGEVPEACVDGLPDEVG